MTSAIELRDKLLFSSAKDRRIFNKPTIVPEEAECQICLSSDQTHEPLVRDCNCSGQSGFVHISCVARAAEIKSNKNIHNWLECSKYWNLCSSCGELHQNELALNLLSQFVKYIEKKHPGDQFSINVINAHVQLLRAIADMYTRTSSTQCNRMGRQIAQGIISKIDEMKKHISTNSSTLPLIIISEVAAINNLANISFAECTIEGVNEARKHYEMCQILCASIGINENDSIIQFAKDGLASVDYFLNETDATLSSDIINQLNQLSITDNDVTMGGYSTTSIEGAADSKCNQKTLESIGLDWEIEDSRDEELVDNSIKNTHNKRQKTESNEQAKSQMCKEAAVADPMVLEDPKQSEQYTLEFDTPSYDNTNTSKSPPKVMDTESNSKLPPLASAKTETKNTSKNQMVLEDLIKYPRLLDILRNNEERPKVINYSTPEERPKVINDSNGAQLICLLDSFKTNDKEHLSLLRDAIESYDPTRGPKGQSLHFRDAVELCEEARIELGTITHYIRVNVFRNIELSMPYSGDKKVMKVKDAVDYNYKLVFVRVVENDSERSLLPYTKKEDVTQVVIQRLSLNVDEDNNVKDIFQLSRPPSSESNVKVYGIPRDKLSPVDDNLFNTETFEDQRQFAKQYQITLPLSNDQVDLFIEQASSYDEPIAALQQILNDTHNNGSLLSQEECSGQFFFFKGVVYFVWIDAPSEVLEMLKETCKDVYEDVRAVKIGESKEDLIKHLKKMQLLLTYLAGAKLCWIAIGIPFGLCSARSVEQWIHFIKIELRKSGEWYSREVLILETIKHILERTGGKVICRGTVSGNPDGQSGNGTVNTRGGGSDGDGWIYFFRQLFTTEELVELWKMYHKLPEGEGKAFIRFLLAFKVGASRDEDPKKRPRKNFWAFVRGRGVFAAVKGFSKVFQQEAKLHRRYKGSKVCHERFMLDPDGNSEIECGTGLEMEAFLAPLRDNAQYDVVEDEIQRDTNKLNYKEREIKEWLQKRLFSLDDIVDMIMKGVFVLLRSTSTGIAIPMTMSNIVLDVCPPKHAASDAAADNTSSNIILLDSSDDAHMDQCFICGDGGRKSLLV